VVKALLEAGANVNARTLEGFQSTALHLAAGATQELAVRLLVELGADVTSEDKYQATPLHRAARGGNPKIVKFLLENGSDVSVQDDKKRLPIWYAVMNNH